MGVSHCGAGSTLGDIVAKWIVYLTARSIAIFDQSRRQQPDGDVRR
jgi:hypothetical protein